MSEPIVIKDGNAVLQPVLVDEVTDGVLGTGAAQFTKIMDGTVNSTNKAVVTTSGALRTVLSEETYTNSLSGVSFLAQALSGFGASTATLQITGTWVATCQFEGTINGTDWFAVYGSVFATGALATTTTVNGQWTFDVAGFHSIRVRTSAYTSGSVVVNMRFSQAAASVSLDAPLPAGANIIGALAANQSVNIAQHGGTTLVTGGVNGSLGVGGVTAAAATATGNPVRIGATARTLNPTAVTDGQVANVQSDKMGRLVVVNHHQRTMVRNATLTLTSTTTETSFIAAGGASIFHDITHLTLTNGSATATTVSLRDATGGTVRAVYNLPAGGGAVLTFDPALVMTTANNAWTLQCGTSVASVFVNAVYVVNL